MGAGRQRAGDRLGVDVALVGEREAELLQRAADIADPGPRANLDALTRAIDADEPLHFREAEQQPARRHHGREGMAGAGDADAQVAARRLGDERGELGLRGGLGLVARDERLVADPVAPMPALAERIGGRLGGVGHGVSWGLNPSPGSCGEKVARSAADECFAFARG